MELFFREQCIVVIKLGYSFYIGYGTVFIESIK